MDSKMLLRREESAALGRRMSWANRLLSESMKGKISNVLREVLEVISIISIQD